MNRLRIQDAMHIALAIACVLVCASCSPRASIREHPCAAAGDHESRSESAARFNDQSVRMGIEAFRFCLVTGRVPRDLAEFRSFAESENVETSMMVGAEFSEDSLGNVSFTIYFVDSCGMKHTSRGRIERAFKNNNPMSTTRSGGNR